MELARIGQAQLDPMSVAQVFKASGMFPDIQSEAAACAKIIIGRGLGLSDYDAMTGLHIIKGKAVLAANLMAAAIKRAGKYDYRAACTDTECSIVFFGRSQDNKWEEIGTTTFSMDDAKRAQLGGDVSKFVFPSVEKWLRAKLDRGVGRRRVVGVLDQVDHDLQRERRIDDGLELRGGHNTPRDQCHLSGRRFGSLDSVRDRRRKRR